MTYTDRTPKQLVEQIAIENHVPIQEVELLATKALPTIMRRNIPLPMNMVAQFFQVVGSALRAYKEQAGGVA